jgi:CheY-like chemotaxis protein
MSVNPLPFADQVVIMETVLVVEDEVVIRSSISEYLRRCAYRVLEAGDAEEALVILRKPSVKVDVLFTNIEMPGSVNGFELARRARELRPEIQVILTGTLERAADAAAGLCEDSPLPKPYEPQVVVDRIKRLLAARASESEP